MSDQLIGYLLIGLGVVAVAAIVAGAARGGARGPLHPPPGVHVPPGSWLPLGWAGVGALLGAGLAFRPDDQVLNWIFALPGLLLLVALSVISVRTAGREWRHNDQGPHDEGAAHH